ncbi:hypothetical protein AB9N12_06275 [Bacteroides sp. AN502(2024)]|uniref:hypothetical protein n=1 Tax=Bacteroides sp. AN502(2024) TaxID=3160599 RepID=UPI0035138A63
MRALYKIESEWEKKRDQMLIGTDEEYKKVENTVNMLKNLNMQILQVLGIENGNWYITYKELGIRALDNMDKYGATYNEGYQIAQIEIDYAKQRKKIWEDHPKNRNEKLQAIEENKLNAIKKAVSTQISERWISINNSHLEYLLTKRYGLSKSQIIQFKNAYNTYAIEEYKIIHDQKKLSTSEKVNLLRNANNAFSRKVRPLFKDSSYKKWEGKRTHDFKQRIERKLNNNTL